MGKLTDKILMEAAGGEEVFYRGMSAGEFRAMMLSGIAGSENTGFLSLSRFINQALQFGDILVGFSAKSCLAQGAIPVEYTPEFFRQRPDVFDHVNTLYGSVSEFIEDEAPEFEGSDEEAEQMYLEYVADFYRSESEIVVPILRLGKGVIKAVNTPGLKMIKADAKLLRALKKFA